MALSTDNVSELDFQGHTEANSLLMAQISLAYKKYAPACPFGHSLATNETCRSQSRETIEPDVRRLWIDQMDDNFFHLACLVSEVRKVAHSSRVKSVLVDMDSLLSLYETGGRVTAPDCLRESAGPSSNTLLRGNPDLLTGEDQIGVFDDFTIGLKDTRIFVGIAIEVLRNLRERITLFDDVILDLLLFLRVVQTRNLNLAHPLHISRH